MYFLYQYLTVTFWMSNMIMLAMLGKTFAAPAFSSSPSSSSSDDTHIPGDNHIPESGDESDDFSEAMNYMSRYGYFKGYFNAGMDNGPFGYVDLVNSIRDVQLSLRVNQTGILDDATMAAIRRPRCGVTDVVDTHRLYSPEEISKRVKRYTVNWENWDKKLITYRILNYPSNSDLTKAQVHEHIDRAFAQFSNVTRLIFKKLTDNSYADIYLQFISWRHGDGFPFDGPNGTVAHAYIPDGRYGDYDGDVHFDDSEEFTHEGEQGYNLYQVALHEIGHSLGLEHSWVADAVMIPDYNGYNPNYKLAEDDIRALQLMYGSGILTSSKDDMNPDAPCNIPYDAVAMIDGKLFIFKDNRYWRSAGFGKLLTPIKGYPIKKRFFNLPTPIDAVYQRPQDGKVVFFKGAEYWVYERRKTDSTYPRPLTDFGLPEDLDAAVILNEYNKTYFFKDHQVWRYDEGYQMVDIGYPYEIKDVWLGIPSPVHAAFDFTDGNTYFVQRKKYYRYSSKHRNADPGFPRFFGQDFIGC